MLRFETVLCPVDFTPLSKSSLALAVEVCRKLGARLVLEHNVSTPPPSLLGVSWMWEEEQDNPLEKRTEWATEQLQALLAEIPADVPHEAKLTNGALDNALEILARQLPADLMVMGTHGPTSEEHSSLTEKAILGVTCPVLTLGEGYDPAGTMAALAGESPDSMTVVIPYDFGRRARTTLDFGLALIERMPHHLLLVHALSETHHPSRKKKEGPVASSRERLEGLIPDGLASRVSVAVAAGDEAAVILEAAEAAGALFILMPAHGKSVMKRFLFGSTTRRVLHGSDCPVLFIPPSYELPG